MAVSAESHRCRDDHPGDDDLRRRPAESAQFLSPYASRSSYTLWQQLRSHYHGWWYQLSEGIRWSRGRLREVPSGALHGLDRAQADRLAMLASTYAVRFEASLSETTALKCYDYLDILHQGLKERPITPSAAVRLHDVGSANFWYAGVLNAYFHPVALTGFEVEGYRLYHDGYSRWDAAQGYVEELPHAQFHVQDYRRVEEPADIITAWFPFVTPTPVLAWRLPLSLFAPDKLFRRIAGNLASGGQFVMVNQGEEEAAVALRYGEGAGLRLRSCRTVATPLRPRLRPPVVSCWYSPT